MPTAWKLSQYNIDLRLFDIGPKERNVKACNSTIAFIASILEEVPDVNIKNIIIVPDTLKNPENIESGDKLRIKLGEYIRDALHVLTREEHCYKCVNLKVEKIFKIVLVPGTGTYYDYKFMGNVEQIFIKIMYSIIKSIKEIGGEKGPKIIVDISHGLNYLTLITVYATIAAILSTSPNLEENLLIINSEAFPPNIKGKRCLKGKRIDLREDIEIPDLNILDFSKMQTVIKIIRSLNSLWYLDERPLEMILDEKILKSGELGFGKNLQDLINFVKAIRLGLIGLIIPNTKIFDPSQQVKPLPFNVENVLERLNGIIEKLETETVKEFEPVIDKVKKVVKYDEANIFSTLKESLLKVKERIEPIEKLKNASDVLATLKNVFDELYREIKQENVGMIVSEELDKIQNKLKKEIVKKGKIKLNRREILDLFKIRGIPKGDSREKIRNILAHAGFIFTHMTNLKYDKRTMEITYRWEIFDLLRELGFKLDF